MMAVTDSEKAEVLEEVIEKLGECATLLRQLHDPEIDAYCLADLEGREGGWLGFFVRDILERQLRTARGEGGEEEEE